MNAVKTFWSLMERWRVSDVEALELIEFWGKTGKSGRRPRFRLNTKQQRTLYRPRFLGHQTEPYAALATG
jgi:hypothetical protein